jgi:hypothetical protein
MDKIAFPWRIGAKFLEMDLTLSRRDHKGRNGKDAFLLLLRVFVRRGKSSSFQFDH